MLHVAQYQPAIPQNTGAIARQCVGMNAHLHIIGPTSFEVTDHAAKRAGLDYWPYLHLTLHGDVDTFLEWLGTRRVWLITKFGGTRFDQADYADEDVLLLGNENHGVPEHIHQQFADTRLWIPMPGTDKGNVRSYNVSNAAAIVLACARVRVSPDLRPDPA
ncbi:tRNA (cytidine(34)-2'-O)-methyltransferase [Mucisphaera sp.]|uniref:tRNA (cytidine(34)-2'-O)-methyltransferase n=1 Tax=Mucisphaera sp. TaxID=2913024 RepID=UPI003D111CE5